MTLADKNRGKDTMENKQSKDGKYKYKRNRTQKGEREGKTGDSSIGPMTGMTGSELEGLSIVESDNLYDSDDNPAGRQYDLKIKQKIHEAALFTRDRKLKNTLGSIKPDKSIDSRSIRKNVHQIKNAGNVKDVFCGA